MSGTALTTVIMAVSSIIVGRLLGPELYGQYTLVLVVPSLLLIFTDLGVSQGITRFTASLRSKGETGRIAGIIKHGLLLRIIIGTIVFIINFRFAEALALLILQRTDLTFYIQIASVSILFHVLLTTSNSAFVGLDKTQYSALTSNIQGIVKASASIALVLLGFGVAGVTAGYLAGAVVATVAAIYLLLPMLRQKERAQDEQSLSQNLKTMIRYGIPLQLSLLLTGLISIYHNILLAAFAADVEIGNFKAAQNFIQVMMVISAPITTALFPAFSKLDSAANKDTKAFFKIANKYAVMIMIPVTFLMIAFSSQIVEIVYGSTYQSASLFLATYCLIYLLTGFGFLTLTSLYNGLGKTRTTLTMVVISFFTNVILSLPLAQTYNVQGLIAATLISNAIGTFYGTILAKAKLRMEFDAGKLVKIHVLSALSAAPSVLILLFLRVPDLLLLAVGGSLSVILYLTLLPLAGIITAPELKTVAQITRRIRLLSMIARPVLAYERRILAWRSPKANK